MTMQVLTNFFRQRKTVPSTDMQIGPDQQKVTTAEMRAKLKEDIPFNSDESESGSEKEEETVNPISTAVGSQLARPDIPSQVGDAYKVLFPRLDTRPTCYSTSLYFFAQVQDTIETGSGVEKEKKRRREEEGPKEKKRKIEEAENGKGGEEPKKERNREETGEEREKVGEGTKEERSKKPREPKDAKQQLSLKVTKMSRI